MKGVIISIARSVIINVPLGRDSFIYQRVRSETESGFIPTHPKFGISFLIFVQIALYHESE